MQCETCSGSPPRLRGAQFKCEGLNDHYRITPAPAGSTGELVYRVTLPRDHPRACGEHAWNSSKITACTGSPPRLRGAQTEILRLGDGRRITPAPAGSTLHLWPPAVTVWDHPRACGEHLSRVMVCPSEGGSPPRLRGARTYTGESILQRRITPAPAGSTF